MLHIAAFGSPAADYYPKQAMNRLLHGQQLAGAVMKEFVFAPLMNSDHGTKHWLDENIQGHIDAYWGSKAAWEGIPDKVSQIHFQEDLSKVVPIDHGYDETKPESELNLSDMQKAAEFRGGKCLFYGDGNGQVRSEADVSVCFWPYIHSKSETDPGRRPLVPGM